MTIKYLQLGKHIKKARTNLSISQTELAKKSGSTQRIISEIESGKYKNPGLVLLDNITKVLKIKIFDLFF